MSDPPPDLPASRQALNKKNISKTGIWIGSILTLSPIWGTIATVIQMIGAFKEITIYGTGDAEALSGGISSALTSTEIGILLMPLGITVLVLSIIGYNKAKRIGMSQPNSAINSDTPLRGTSS